MEIGSLLFGLFVGVMATIAWAMPEIEYAKWRGRMLGRREAYDHMREMWDKGKH